MSSLNLPCSNLQFDQNTTYILNTFVSNAKSLILKSKSFIEITNQLIVVDIMQNKKSKTHYNKFDNKQIKCHDKSTNLKMHSCKGTKKTIMQNESSGPTQYALK